jgi:tryptophan synthase alpha chain
MTRLREAMKACGASGRKALVIYLTEGDPTPEATAEIVAAAAGAGADVIELGVPFSDPNADGAVIQAAMQRARAAGAGLSSALETVERVRARGCEVPLVLFGYYNPVFVFGVERFAARASAAGVDAVLTVALPLDELDELATPLSRAGLDVVPLVAPTSGPDRVARLRELDPPFVYYISMTGVTGAAFQGAAGGAERVARLREAARAPVAVGFGIKTGDDARQVAAYADGVVVGSAVVKRIEDAEPGQEAEAVAALVAELRAAIDAG